MDNPAKTTHPIHDLLSRRWSPRAFADRMIERAKLGSVLEAARWAPSCYNEQPWFFIVATKENPEEYNRLLGCLVEFNQQWAGKAPVLMLSVAKLQFERNQKPNRHATHDVGLATENLVIQATALGLVAHQMAGFDADKARERFQIPADCEPMAAIALGYPGDPKTLPLELSEKELAPRARKPLASFVFAGRWGAPSPLARAGSQ